MEENIETIHTIELVVDGVVIKSLEISGKEKDCIERFAKELGDEYL